MRTITTTAALACAVFFAGVASRAWAQSSEGEKVTQSTAEAPAGSGADEFVRHCALCHGLDGRGDGPLAQAMKIVPTDLTRIAARHKGEFPSAKVADVIRNGGGVLGHGSSAMLAWGLYFSEKHNPAVGRARIAELVRYIQSLQEK
jgi:mono/diheme cytochrome c family protein